ncbi:MAG: nickel transporter permease [Lachnospiraceae bacterium]
MTARTNRWKVRVFLGLAIVLLLAAILAKWLVPYDPYEQDLSQSLQSPSIQHWMGTDQYGRDMFSRVLMGARASLSMTLLLVAVIAVFGTAVGILCGYKGGKVDAIVMRISDVFLAFPGLVFAIAIAGILGGGMQNAVLSLAVISWPKYARIARGQVLLVKEMPYVAAARLSHTGTGKIILRHILPNSMDMVLITAMLDIGTMMMELAGLSYLGLGAAPPMAEWGSMMSTGRSMLQTAPWVILAPGAAIFCTVAIFNLLGDSIRDVLEPGQAESAELGEEVLHQPK